MMLENMSQKQLVKIGELMLGAGKKKYKKGTRKRESYEAALALLGVFPHQPWYKRKWSAWRKKLAENKLRKIEDARRNCS